MREDYHAETLTQRKRRETRKTPPRFSFAFLCSLRFLRASAPPRQSDSLSFRASLR